MKSNNSKVVSPKDIQKEIIALAIDAVKGSYGVQEIALNMEKKGKEERISVKMHSDKTFDVDVHVIMAKDVKITEALFECQKVIKYRLDRKYAKLCRSVNVYADGVSSK